MGKTCRLRSQNGVDYGGPLGAGTTKREEKRFKRERPVGWGARAGSMVWDLKGSQQEADGQQRANTVMRYVGPMRAIDMMPVVGNVEPEYFLWDLQGLSMGRQGSTT